MNVHPQYSTYNDQYTGKQTTVVTTTTTTYLEVFEDPSVRLGFIRKVYGILSVQFLLTSLMVFFASAPTMWPDSFDFAQGYIQLLRNPGMMAMCFGLLIISICALVCFGCDRTVPINYVLLFSFTFAEGWLVSVLCTKSNP